MRFTFTSAVFLLLFGFGIAHAEVQDVSANSLRVRQVQTVSASPDRVWQSFLHIERWWSGDHTFSGDAANLRLESKPGGCFCESLPNGGGVLHMSVVYVEPGKRMTMSGALGPLQDSGARGALTFLITARGEASEISLVYNIGGYYPGGLDSIGGGVDMVLGEQLRRLKRLIETGTAAAKPEPK
ncbi:MAG: SRPBCC family protein [Acidobacteriota bacterium]